MKEHHLREIQLLTLAYLVYHVMVPQKFLGLIQFTEILMIKGLHTHAHKQPIYPMYLIDEDT